MLDLPLGNQQKTFGFYQGQLLCLNDERDCFAELHQHQMGGWIVVHGEGVMLLSREVSLQSRRTCKLEFVWVEIFIAARKTGKKEVLR